MSSTGQVIKQSTIDTAMLTGPGEDLVTKLIMQMSSVTGFVSLFGPYKGTDQQRWADYQRFDWSIRQLPAINIFESPAETKDSDNAWLNGAISIQVLWPPSMRRPDSRRVEAAFKGALENFFASQYVADMLDELYWIQRPMKVYGLNELGKQLTWTPNAETIVESQAIPVTIVEVRYRIDLRSWYRALEYMDRTKENPFAVTLAPLTEIGRADGTNGYLAEVDGSPAPVIIVPVDITVSNP